MEVRVSSIVRTFIFILLFAITVGVIISGPFYDFIKRENKYLHTNQKINNIDMPLKWPDLILCKSPMIKDEQKYVEFMRRNYQNQSQFTKLKDDI